MSATSVQQERPPIRDVEATPPAPEGREPRTERHDWLFVGYPNDRGVTRNEPADLYVADPAELPRAIAALDKRDRAGARYPYIFLAPTLAEYFVDTIVAARLAQERARCWEQDCPARPCGDPTHRLRAETWASVIDLARLKSPEWRAASEAANVAEADRIFEEAFDLAVAAVPADDRKWVKDWLQESWYDHLEHRDLPHALTLEALATEGDRCDIRARLHAAEQFPGGWTIILDDGGEYTENYQRVSTLRTPGGARFVKQTDYAALSTRTVLPVAAARLVGFLRGWHADHQPEDYGCDKFPSDQTIARFLKEGGITDPAPNAVVARTAADLAADPAAMRAPVVVLPRLAWAGRVTLLAAREKQGKSTLAGAAVAALTRAAPWLGGATTAGTVLWLHEEAEGDTVARLQRFGADLNRVHLLRLPLADAARDLAANIARVRPTLVVIDSLFTFAGGRVTQSADAAQWWPILTPICDVAHAAGVAVLILHHAGKATGEYRDSTAIGGMVDQLVQVPRGLQGNRQTLEAIGRVTGVPPFTITVELAGDAHRLVGGDAAPAADALTEQHEQALAELRRLVPTADAPAVTSGEWEKATDLTGTTFGRVRDALADVFGRVERIGERGKRGQRFRPRP